jgi:agmatinase
MTENPGATPFNRENLQATQMMNRLKDIGDERLQELGRRALELGLEAAESVEDRRISTFVRGGQPAFAGINTFLKSPYVEDVRDIGNYEVAFVGAPFDMGTTYRPGTRFGPQAVRRVSALYDGYSLDLGVDILEELIIGDIGDIFVIPSNIEKTFDQIDKAVSHIYESGAFPVIVGGDHSVSYPNIRGISQHIDGNLGIIHFDRHIDIQEKDMDERMHTTHFFHATNLPNVKPENLVQIAIGGWYGSRPGLTVARERETTVITIGDIESMGIERAVEIALEVAWKGTKEVFLSFDIDSVDIGFTPGTGSPEPGGLLPREALKAVRMIAKEGICGMDLVEISPPYDVSDMTAQLGCRVIMDVLGVMVAEGHIGKRKAK